MKNEYVRPLVVFLTVLAITFFTFITINNSFSTYESGQIFEPTDKIYSLVGYRKNSTTEKYYFDIVVEDMNQQLVLLYGFIPDGITVNGNVIVQPAGFNSSQFSSVLVDREWFNIQTNSVTLEFNGKNNPYNQPVYLSSVEGASKWLSAYYMIFAFNIGIVFIMSLYGLSLYLNKPGEDYLF
jgi:two-component system phosphate regulon sensor histidine kinase PhoR